MDPVTAFGVATAVIGLVPICANGYTFIEGICTAEKGVQKQLKKLLIQRRVSLTRADLIVLLTRLLSGD